MLRHAEVERAGGSKEEREGGRESERERFVHSVFVSAPVCLMGVGVF